MQDVSLKTVIKEREGEGLSFAFLHFLFCGHLGIKRDHFILDDRKRQSQMFLESYYQKVYLEKKHAYYYYYYYCQRFTVERGEEKILEVKKGILRMSNVLAFSDCCYGTEL